jgi:hypothetical protein
VSSRRLAISSSRLLGDEKNKRKINDYRFVWMCQQQQENESKQLKKKGEYINIRPT